MASNLDGGKRKRASGGRHRRRTKVARLAGLDVGHHQICSRRRRSLSSAHASMPKPTDPCLDEARLQSESREARGTGRGLDLPAPQRPLRRHLQGLHLHLCPSCRASSDSRHRRAPRRRFQLRSSDSRSFSDKHHSAWLLGPALALQHARPDSKRAGARKARPSFCPTVAGLAEEEWRQVQWRRWRG